MIAISVVIGTRNQARILEPVLLSFGAQTFDPDAFEVIVVDSASEDATAEVCQAGRYAFALRSIRRPDGGKAVARNVGLMAARGEVVLLTDADVLSDDRLLEQHWAARIRHPAAIVVGQQYMVDRPVRDATGARACLNADWEHGRELSWREFVTGNASCPREALVAAGGFDVRFRAYGYEDYELGYRLALAGHRFVFAPEAVNYHYHPVSFEDDVVRKRGAGQGAAYFASRHPSWRLRQHLGVTPVNRALYRPLREEAALVRLCRRLAGRSSVIGRVARHIVLETAFQAGARAGWSKFRYLRDGPGHHPLAPLDEP